MSDKKRVVYVLHELEGLTPNDISKVVGAPVLTVRTRLFYARREVLAMLREEPALAAIADEIAGPESPRETRGGRVARRGPQGAGMKDE